MSAVVCLGALSREMQLPRCANAKSLHVATPDEQLAQASTKGIVEHDLAAHSFTPGRVLVSVGRRSSRRRKLSSCRSPLNFAAGLVDSIECPSICIRRGTTAQPLAQLVVEALFPTRLPRVAKTGGGGVDGAASSRLRVDLGSLDSMDSRCRIPLSCRPHTGTADNLSSSRTAGRLCHVPGTRDTNRPTAPMPTRLQPGRQLPEQKSKSPVSS